jgi:hypothetical protein
MQTHLFGSPASHNGSWGSHWEVELQRLWNKSRCEHQTVIAERENRAREPSPSRSRAPRKDSHLCRKYIPAREGDLPLVLHGALRGHDFVHRSNKVVLRHFCIPISDLAQRLVKIPRNSAYHFYGTWESNTLAFARRRKLSMHAPFFSSCSDGTPRYREYVGRFPFQGLSGEKWRTWFRLRTF